MHTPELPASGMGIAVMPKPTNPNLFVGGYNGSKPEYWTEITLRDLFAAAALAGTLADTRCSGSFSDFSKDAFAYADAMLAEREKRDDA